MTYKLLVTDLDGTLLNTQRTLSPRIQHAVTQAKQRGKYMTFATGRNYTSTLPMIQILSPNAPLILCNGARIERILPRTTLYAKNLPRESALKAFKLQNEFPIHISLYLDDDIYVKTLTPEAQEFMEKEHIPCHPVGDLDRFLGDRDPIKLLCIGDPEDLTRYAQAYRAFDSDTELVRSEPNYLELLPSCVSKGGALRYLAEYLEISLQEIIAVGDNPNDIDMIREAGLGVAMDNAHPDVKKIADRITDSNDNNGVAKVIEQYLFS